MADFNDNLRRIGSETKALQAVHLNAQKRLREETQKVESLKAEIAEQTSSRDVSLLFIACILAVVYQESHTTYACRNAKMKMCRSLAGP